jgi:hypothetical protein
VKFISEKSKKRAAKTAVCAFASARHLNPEWKNS